MQKGFSFHDALHLIETAENSSCVKAIEKEALSGRKLNEVLIDKVHPSLRSYVQGFSSCMTLSEAVSASIEIHKSEEALKQKLIKELLYPMLLLAGVLAGIFLFSNTILPSMIAMMAAFQAEKGDLLFIQKTIHILIAILLSVCISLTAFVLWKLHPSRIAATLKQVSVISSSSLLNQYASILFTRYFLACVKRHVPTRMALVSIQKLKDNPLPAEVASMLDKQLSAGENMQKAVGRVYLEDKLVSFFRIAMHAGECSSMLEGYLEMAERRAQKQVRLFSRTIQLICYGCIAVILILVYRILMMPMQLLKTL